MQPLRIERLFGGDTGTLHVYLAIDMCLTQIDRAAKLRVAQDEPESAYIQPLRIEPHQN